jgi:hypothetical protein
LVVAVAAVVTTALEVGEPCPETSVYLALGGDIGKYEKIRDLLLNGGMITIRGHSIGLTPKGKALAEEINKTMAKA